ncbi:MAG: Bax inhibitor-1 family protein [Chitinispirillia bacterium]|nr:Bax inhibitor-1 family protein [Chitinispirillia bacterium]
MGMMRCQNCGAEVSGGASGCARCGGQSFEPERFDASGRYQARGDQLAAVASTRWDDCLVMDVPTAEQAAFYRKTYLTAGGAFVAWMLTLYTLFSTGIAYAVFSAISSVSWLVVLGVFWLSSYLGGKLTFAKEKNSQLLGLAIYVVAYALIFIPLLVVVESYAAGSVLLPALVATLTIFAALTAVVFLSRTDFSFLKSIVVFGSFIAMGAIIIFVLTGASLGSWFSIAMIILMSATILYETHQIKTQFNTNQHIGAGAMLFASFIVLLWYIIRLFMSRR